MIKVVFVGDEPSPTNISHQIAFVGAKCFERLVGWIKYLQPDYYICLNSNTDDDMLGIESLVDAGFQVVALGNKASKRLQKYDIDHWKLPHPSGLNRKLNDEKAMALELLACYEWLIGIRHPISGAF